jgi:hypothetical protein
MWDVTLVWAKIMVSENHFRFDRKNFFNFWKTIYGFKNCKSFSEIILFVFSRTFDIRLSESGNSRSSESKRHRNPATSGYQNNAGAGIQPPSPDAGGPNSSRIWPKSGHGQKPAGFDPIREDLAKMAGIRLDMTGSGQTCLPESGNGDRTLLDSSDSCIFHFS